ALTGGDRMKAWGWVLSAAVACALGGAAAAKTVVGTADHMIDVLGGKVLEHPGVVIADGRIVEGGPQGQGMSPPGAEHVDLPGETLLPGLIDMHVHLDSSPLFGGYTYLQFTDSFWAVIGTKHAKDTLEAGFTTVRNVGSDRFNDVALMQAVEEG